eukprot:CAMPEP_0172326988 /NCGR_PEP_ID=MMETSP1058-20130122/58221_1 /TAXON_ID=83371 /ORGANISM="Detonula confervacea, Strain CCMP 353" /LENGTH=582 /DNA_ID=CAMNT_0013043905 /DNA_START=106 /DNA_END=1855 /DNA_ORIENTATION=+
MDNVVDGSTNEVHIIYMGGDAVTEDVTHVRVDPSVTVIRSETFRFCLNLQEVELPEGLLKVESRAFSQCKLLTKIIIPSTVEEIGSEAFEWCEKLEEVVLPKGLQKLGRRAFFSCRSLQRIIIPPKVQTIEAGTFSNCCDLIDVVFSEGLREIRGNVFSHCTSLLSVNLPSSLKVINEMAFNHCTGLTEMNLPDRVECIHGGAFSGCNFQNFRIPPLVTNVDMGIFHGHSCIVSLELSAHVRSIIEDSPYACAELAFLRNIFIPQECRSGTVILGRCKELGKVFSDGDSTAIANALQQRFNELPIHKICYYQSYHHTWAVMSSLKREINPWSSKFLGKLNVTGKQADCLGMTPLHILACSTKHDVEMYRILIEKYPETLIAKDRWGDIPIAYSFWVKAPPDVTQLLVESHKSLFPEYVLDWGGMVKTLAKSNTPLANIQHLLNTQQNCFPDQKYNMQDVVMEVAKSSAKRSVFYLPCTRVEIFRYLLRVSISKRLDSLAVKRWRIEMENSVNEFPDRAFFREEDTRQFYSKLSSYETLKEATSLLELVLWKANIGNTCQMAKSAATRRQGLVLKSTTAKGIA